MRIFYKNHPNGPQHSREFKIGENLSEFAISEIQGTREELSALAFREYYFNHIRKCMEPGAVVNLVIYISQISGSTFAAMINEAVKELQSQKREANRGNV